MGKALQTPELDEDGQLILRGELFWKWKALHEAVQRCDAEIKLRNPLIDALLDQQPDLKKLLGERSTYIQQSVTARHEYKTVLAALEAHFGFSMAEVSIDDITGVVHRLSPAPVPVAPVKNGVNAHTPRRPAKPSPVASGSITRKTPTKKKRT